MLLKCLSSQSESLKELNEPRETQEGEGGQK